LVTANRLVLLNGVDTLAFSAILSADSNAVPFSNVDALFFADLDAVLFPVSDANWFSNFDVVWLANLDATLRTDFDPPSRDLFHEFQEFPEFHLPQLELCQLSLS